MAVSIYTQLRVKTNTASKGDKKKKKKNNSHRVFPPLGDENLFEKKKWNKGNKTVQLDKRDKTQIYT